ncbi:MAG TPA: class I SAM-dependent methyltransferase [Pyrinomonadaceae bacterium]
MAVSEREVKSNFEELIEGLDIKLFEKISSQTTERDKRSLLACQLAVRTLRPNYTYLEIGSYLGGSLQPFLLDEQCQRIYSIDKRPPVQPDERGINYEYLNNSTQRMLDNLKAISEAGLSKIITIDEDARNIDAGAIEHQPQMCFIDGEHTDEAAFTDFLFCLKVLEQDGLLVFHDAPVVYNGLARIVAYLEERGIRFRAYNLPDTVFVVEVGEFPIHQSAPVQEMLLNNHVGYLMSLQCNDHYRRFANRPLFKWLRHLKLKATKAHVSQ